MVSIIDEIVCVFPTRAEQTWEHEDEAVSSRGGLFQRQSLCCDRQPSNCGVRSARHSSVESSKASVFQGLFKS